MATRNTKAQAQEIKEKFEKLGFQIRITESSGVQSVGRWVAERKGFEIIEDNGGIRVKCKVTSYLIQEVRQCRDCGKEILTEAIGETAEDDCKDCYQTYDFTGNESTERVKEMAWRDEWEQA